MKRVCSCNIHPGPSRTRVPPFSRVSSRRRRSCQVFRRFRPFCKLSDGAVEQQLRISTKRVLKQLSSLQLAIVELAAIAALSTAGTIIKQNEGADYYVQNYADGWLTYQQIWALQLDHIYTANYFLLLLALLSASLAACSTTRQWPMLKAARRWRMARSHTNVAASGSLENAMTLPDADLKDFGMLLRNKGYSVFLKNSSLYAFKGLAGRFAPIGVHISMLVSIAGIAVSGLAGLSGSVMVPSRGEFVIADSLHPKSALAKPAKSLQSAKLQVDEFEYSSKVSVRDKMNDKLLSHKTISVNQPLRYKGMTAYQTDWSIAALTLGVQKAEQEGLAGTSSFNLPVASMEGQPGISGKLWATFLPLEASSKPGESPRGISLVMRDMQSVAIYDSQGSFVGIRRPGSGKLIQVEGLDLEILDMVGSTGLELKVDPGVPYVYAGFAGLMVTTVLSYLSHAQIWALQQENLLHISGKSNRARLAFQDELASLIDLVPDKQE